MITHIIKVSTVTLIFLIGMFLISDVRNEVIAEEDSSTKVGHVGGVNAVAFSPDGNWLVSGGTDATVRLWEVQTGDQVKVFFDRHGEAAFDGGNVKHDAYAVRSVAVNSSGTLVAAGIRDRTARIWDFKSGQELKVFKPEVVVHFVAFSPDSQYLATSAFDDTIRLWEVSTGREARVLKGYHGWPTSAFFSPTGRQVIAAIHEGTVQRWDTESGELQQSLDGICDVIRSFTMTRDGQWMAAGCFDGSLVVWRNDGVHRRIVAKLPSVIDAVAFSQDDTLLITGGADYAVRLWDRATGQERRVLQGHTAPVHSIAVSPNGRVIASSAHDGTIRLWDISTGQLLRVLGPGSTQTGFHERSDHDATEL